MINSKSSFAVFFGNCGFFPASLMADARAEMAATLEKLGHKFLMLEESATRYGAVETPAEGETYANFLKSNRGRYDGVILCLPNFGDETGAVAALQDAGVPIWIQAYPDEYDKMGTAWHRETLTPSRWAPAPRQRTPRTTATTWEPAASPATDRLTAENPADTETGVGFFC